MAAAQRKSFPSESEIHQLAASQHGVFTQDQARDAGLSPSGISRRVTSGMWERVLPGVYRIVGASSAGHHQVAMAASLWAGPDALASFGSAAVLWGIDGARVTKVELWVPPERAKRSERVTMHRGLRLDRADRTVLDGIPITTPTRTLIDYSARLEDEALLAAMEDVFRRGLSTPERLAARLTALRTSGRPGAGRLEALLDSRPADAESLESRLEAKVWRMLVSARLPPCVRQHWVIVGDRRYRLDFSWPHHLVAVECDGWAYHGRERFERDEARRADLASEGWRIVPVTWSQCTQSTALTIDRVTRALRRAA